MSVKGLNNGSLLKKKKIILLCLIVFPLFLLIYPIIDLSTQSYIVFPGKDITDRIGVFNDRLWNGKSSIEEFTYNSESFTFKYILRPGAFAPLVIISINLDPTYKPIDLSHFDSVSLWINEATTKRIMLIIKTFEMEISYPEPEYIHTLRHNQHTLQLKPDTHHYTIKLHKFVTPQWWTSMMNVDRSKLSEETFKRVVAFDIQCNQEGSSYLINRLEQVSMEKIAFTRSISIATYMIFSILIIYYTSLGIIFIAKSPAFKAKQLPRQKHLMTTSYRDRDLLRIKDFIESNYHDPNISTRMVYEELGIPPARVFNLLKGEYNITFKQLINRMRIEEAKRLLKETDLRIIDIAFDLGFNNISYFNSLFKKFEAKTPSKYRDNEIKDT